MIKDLRYIIKKILIGIGICVGLFYLKSCNVYAQNIQHIEYVEPFYNYTFDYDLDLDSYSHYFLKIKYSSTQVRYDLYYFNGVVNFECYWSTNCNVNGTIDTTKNRTIRAKRNESFSSVVYSKIYTISNNTYTTSTTNNPIFYETNFDSFNLAVDTNNGVSIYTGNPVLVLINYDLSVNNNVFTISKDYYNNNNFYDPTPPPPYIDSINAEPILTDDDSILLGYDFTFSVENFDSDNYKYFYKVGDSPRLQLFQNNYNFSVRTNTTIYFIIEDLEGNLIDSQTFTITDLGTLYSGDYDITFTYNSLTNSDMYDSGTVFSDTIVRTDIDFTFFPKTNTLKYQYQYVKTGDSLDSNNWVLLNENNTSVNNKNLAVSDNGILYARILDLEDNLLFSTTFQVDSIGQVMVYDKNASKINNSFNRIKNQLNFGGPVSSLFIIPVNVLQVMYGSITNTCTPYSMGSIDNHEIVLPCIYPEHYLGSTLWNMIDLIFSGCMIFAIFKFLMRMYYNFVLLQNTSDIESKTGFDERSGS